MATSVDSSAAAQAEARVAALFRQAVLLHREGKTAPAERGCTQVLALDPGHAGAWHLRGLIAFAAGEADRGMEFLERSLSLDAGQPAAHLNVGNYWLGKDRPERALASFERALCLRRDYVLAWYNRGNALRALGRPGEALPSYDEALRLQPHSQETLRNRGLLLLLDLAQPEAALQDFDCLCGLAAQDPSVWCARGNALLTLKRYDQAAASYERALRLAPDLIEALNNRSAALIGANRAEEALGAAERALRIAPDSALSLSHIGNALLQLGRTDEALARYDEASRIEPSHADHLHNRGVALRRLTRFGEAARCFEQLLEIDPGRDYALGYLLQLRMDCCDWSGHDELVARIGAAVDEGLRVVNPLSLLLMADSPSRQRACAELFSSEKYPSLGDLGVPQARAPGKKIRLAYVSADFREHPVSHLLVGVLERHDRNRFEVIGICIGPTDEGPFGQRVRRAFDRFIPVAGRSDQRVAALMRELEIDIAVDLMGFTDGMRLGIFALRAAPVQVAYLGYAGTLGVGYMDYVLADEVSLPRAVERQCTERVVRLPHCVLPSDDRREIAARPARSEAGLPDEGFVYCAFTAACKTTPSMFGLWMRLLRGIPGSVLWLRYSGPEARANLEHAAERSAVDPRRLIFAPRVEPMERHLARLACADLFLDTFPYNAHSTACDALWSGVPIVTCAGESFASRLAASVLTAAGLTELIASTPAQYEALALQLARDPPALRVLRERLAATRRSVPLFDTGRYCRDLETAYDGMWHRHVRGEAPAA